MDEETAISGRFARVLIVSLFVLGLYFISLYSYLLFHSLAEIFSIIIACGIFMIAWNSRRLMENNSLLFLGMAYLFVGGLDLIHTLSYKGMGIFETYDADLPTQLWIAARYLEAFSLLLAPLVLKRKLKIDLVLLGFSLVVTWLFLSIFLWDVFPECFVEGSGLTPFKKGSEYTISLILMMSAFLFNHKKDYFDKTVFRFLVASIFLTICAELAFTLYVSVYGFSNLIGHLFKIISFYLIYKAVIETGLSKPYGLMFRNLKQSEETLREEKTKLQAALTEVKKLSGLLPICSSCKKIRDDRGYWTELESYIDAHSEAKFSHGICPDCARKLYPDFCKKAP